MYSKFGSSTNIHSSTQGTEKSTAPMVLPDQKNMSLEEFLKQGVPRVCTVSQSANNMTTTGKIYVDSERVRGEFVTKINAVDTNTSFVMRDSTIYLWTSGASAVGIQMAITPQNSTAEPFTGIPGFDPKQASNYHCGSWRPDASKFEIPTSVKFTKFN